MEVKLMSIIKGEVNRTITIIIINRIEKKKKRKRRIGQNC
jgi:hypothetical protein